MAANGSGVMAWRRKIISGAKAAEESGRMKENQWQAAATNRRSRRSGISAASWRRKQQ